MGIVSLFKREKIRTYSVLEFQGHPLSKHFVACLKASKWSELEMGLDQLSLDELHPVLCGLAEFATDWDRVPELPEYGRLLLLKCYIQIVESWLARSGNQAKDVTAEQFEEFDQRLSILNQSIDTYRRANPECPLVYVPMFKMAMGQSRSVDELYQIFIKYSRNTHQHLSAHMSMAYALTEQWKGSHTDLFSFCRTAAKESPRFSPLIAYAHYMRWFFNYFWEDGSENKTYFLERSIEKELSEAFHLYMNESVPAYEKRIGVNYFAFCFAKGSSKENLRLSLKYINRSILPKPWSMDYEDVVLGVNVLREYCKLPKV